MLEGGKQHLFESSRVLRELARAGQGEWGKKEMFLRNTTLVSFNGFVYPSVAFLNNIFGVFSQNKLLCEAEVEAAGSVIFSPLKLHPLACLLYSFDISLNHIATDQK